MTKKNSIPVEKFGDDLQAFVDDWLATRHVALWGRSFEIVAPDTRAKGAEWFTSELQAFAAWLNEVPGP